MIFYNSAEALRLRSEVPLQKESEKIFPLFFVFHYSFITNLCYNTPKKDIL